MKGRKIYTTVLLLGISASLGMGVSAQRISDSERLLMENIRLRQANDSLRHALYVLQDNTVFTLWDEITGLAQDSDNEYDYSCFGLDGVRQETEHMKKISACVPSFTIAYNDIFDKYIDLYTISRKGSMPYVLGRYYKHLPEFRKVFSKYGVPEELTALCIVESAVSPRALSKAGALGLWQLMPETARMYGLVVDEAVDQRLDVSLSTDAAARVLRDLRKSLGSWELAVLAYNCGAGTIRKAIILSGSNGVWDIYQHLPAETRAYLPSFIGARYCDIYRAEYGIKEKTYAKDSFDVYVVSSDSPIVRIAAEAGVPDTLLAEINCQYIAGIVPSGMAVRVPRGLAKKLKEANL